MPQSRNE